MTTVNGAVGQERPRVSSANLGKRKRTTSPDAVAGRDRRDSSTTPSLQHTLTTMLHTIRKHDSSPSLLKCELPSAATHTPLAKRTRTSSAAQEHETIETRILSGAYASFDALAEDVDRASKALLQHLPGSETAKLNGNVASSTQSAAALRADIATITDLILKHRHQSPAEMEEETVEETEEKTEEKTADEVVESAEPALSPTENNLRGRVLSLRSQTDSGIKQLFSGLPLAGQRSPSDSDPVPGPLSSHERSLPNGFELTDTAVMTSDPEPLSTNRTFGDVFRPHDNLKPLEQPTTAQSPTAGSTLHFMSVFEQLSRSQRESVTNHDYKYTSLPTGSWLRYVEDKQTQRAINAKSGPDVVDFTTVTGPDASFAASESLFKASYTSFAPSIDNSKAVIPDFDRNRQWWTSHGRTRLSSLLRDQPSGGLLVEPTTQWEASTIDFGDVVDGFVPPSEDEREIETTDVEDVNVLMQEVSDLLETLSSYQTIRSLEMSSKPSSSEFDIYELLKSQLIVLISTLPPFAVAKLNGEQLQSLNITPEITIRSVDYPGTGQVDEYTRRKAEAAQDALTAASKTATGSQLRGAAYPQTTAGGTYNSAARTYNSNVPAPSPATYASRMAPATSYQTPRPPTTTVRPSFSQPASNNFSSTPTVQQFQRPVQNGYPSYSTTTPAQGAYFQRPTQPSYQQRAQESPVAYGRSNSPQKPMTNGQFGPGATQRLHQQQSTGFSPALQHATPEQRIMMERVKAQNEEKWRQNSGTPQPPTPASGDGRYNGSVENRAPSTVDDSRRSQPPVVEGLH